MNIKFRSRSLAKLSCSDGRTVAEGPTMQFGLVFLVLACLDLTFWEVVQATQKNTQVWIKQALDKYNIIPQLFLKKLGFLYH